jgi:AcrR family transcriptional regulator
VTSNHSKRRTRRRPVSPDAILDEALKIADEKGWALTSLSDVAASLDVSLADIRSFYRDKNALADAWFERALAVMLAEGGDAFAALPADERIAGRLQMWFRTLALHRDVTRSMLTAKLYPGHPHHWVPMVFDLSRFVHWLLDAADLNSPPPRRQLEEIALTGVVVASVSLWIADPTPGQRLTERFASRAVKRGGNLFRRIPLPV